MLTSEHIRMAQEANRMLRRGEDPMTLLDQWGLVYMNRYGGNAFDLLEPSTWQDIQRESASMAREQWEAQQRFVAPTYTPTNVQQQVNTAMEGVPGASFTRNYGTAYGDTVNQNAAAKTFADWINSLAVDSSPDGMTPQQQEELNAYLQGYGNDYSAMRSQSQQIGSRLGEKQLENFSEFLEKEEMRRVQRENPGFKVPHDYYATQRRQQ